MGHHQCHQLLISSSTMSLISHWIITGSSISMSLVNFHFLQSLMSSITMSLSISMSSYWVIDYQWQYSSAFGFINVININNTGINNESMFLNIYHCQYWLSIIMFIINNNTYYIMPGSIPSSSPDRQYQYWLVTDRLVNTINDFDITWLIDLYILYKVISSSLFPHWAGSGHFQLSLGQSLGIIGFLVMLLACRLRRLMSSVSFSFLTGQLFVDSSFISLWVDYLLYIYYISTPALIAISWLLAINKIAAFIVASLLLASCWLGYWDIDFRYRSPSTISSSSPLLLASQS